MLGATPVPGERVRESETEGIEADQAAEGGQALLVAQPAGLIGGLVDGDHQAAVELQDVEGPSPQTW
jgi:hypothetical protein